MNANVASLLEAAARLRPDKPVLIQAADGAAVGWAGCERRAGAVARLLAGRGIGRGARVAVAMPDPAELVVALYGALKAGAAVTPLNPRLTADEQAQITADLDPAMVIGALPDGEAEVAGCAVGGAEPAIILYTSGSTGRPKGVLLSHGATAWALESWRGPVMDLGPGDVSLSALPLAHSLGIFGSVLAPLISGGAVVFLPRFTPEAAIAAIARHRITVFPGVATMFHRIIECEAIARADFSSLRYALSGAAPCPWDLACDWKRATGTRIVRGYGMTELFRPISYGAADPTDIPESIGRAVPGVELRLVDDDGGATAPGGTGELLIRSPARMTAYLGQSEATRAVLDGAWFRTGDLATISPDGHVRIVGRKKDMILRGGYTIAAGEIEIALLKHPEIIDAAVIGVPHHELGEEVAAFVALKPGSTLAPEDIVAYCKGALAGYKYPRHVRIEPRLPKGPTGKVLKAQLRL